MQQIPIIRRTPDREAYESLVASGTPPLLARLYAARGVGSAAELEFDLSKLLPLYSLELEASLSRLQTALREQEPIVVVGDYDADGATGTTLAVSSLREFGAQVSYLLPNRFTQGYGLSPVLAEIAAEQGAKIILTVDNGIASVSGVQRAQELGMEVIVTDHHLPGAFLPQTPYIINPNRPGCPFPSKALCGVGVVYYLMAGLWRDLVMAGKVDPKGLFPMKSLDLVALGTVADVVPLDANNRRLVRAGLDRIRRGEARPGIKALLEVADIAAKDVTERDLGFALGPRINAAGRLEDMHIGVEMLLSATVDEALPYAQRLDALNRERRTIEGQRTEAALDTLSVSKKPEQRMIIIQDPDGHEGVVGLVAGRIREQYFCPAIVFAPAEDPQFLKGSARSVPGVHIRDLLARVDAQYVGLIEKFGGHAMAAGLSIRAARFSDFAIRCQEIAGALIDPALLRPIQESDGPLPLEAYNPKFVEVLQDLGPWGQAFPAPTFDDAFRVKESRRVGKDQKTLRLRLQLARNPQSPLLTAIKFRCDHPETEDPQPGREIQLHFQLQRNWYQGVESVQLFVLSWLS